MCTIIEKKIIVNRPQALIDVLSEASKLPKQTLKSALDKGCVWLKNGNKVKRIRRVKKPLNSGDEVFLYFNEKILSSTAPPAQLLLDKNLYSVWFKPAGVFSQGSKWGDHCTLTRLSEKQLNRNSFLVHRLDRATSGLMLIAHTKTTAQQLCSQFAKRQVNKTYLSVVEGIFPSEPVILNTPIEGKNAVSLIQKINNNKQRSLLEIKIETGRKHQIRKHLSNYGYPIVGDRLHGNANKNTLENLQLQAVSLDFNCPITQQNITIKVEKAQQIQL
jgi:tRNA pseudouridine32 synthase/23S rRNA pseudouridine746 synthase